MRHEYPQAFTFKGNVLTIHEKSPANTLCHHRPELYSDKPENILLQSLKDVPYSLSIVLDFWDDATLIKNAIVSMRHINNFTCS